MSALELNELPNQLTIEDSARGVVVGGSEEERSART